MQSMPDRPGEFSQSLCSYQINWDSWLDQEMGSALSLAGNQHSDYSRWLSGTGRTLESGEEAESDSREAGISMICMSIVLFGDTVALSRLPFHIEILSLSAK